MMMQTRSAGVDWMSSVGGSATIARFRADLPDCAYTGPRPVPAAPSAKSDDSAIRRRVQFPRGMLIS